MRHAACGMTVVELVVAVALMLGITAAMFAAVQTLPDAVAVRTEAADMQQRVRVGVDSVLRDLVSASAVRPYRWGGLSADPPGTFKVDTITSIGARTVTYWLKSDDSAGTYQLMSYAGGASPDVPVVDHVVRLAFAYFGDARPAAACVSPAGAATIVALNAVDFADGPWCPSDTSADRSDADLLRVRTISATLRVESAIAALRGPAGPLFAHAGTARAGRRWAPDVEVRFAVSPRNLDRHD